MLDARFFDTLAPATLGELARLTGAAPAEGVDPARRVEGVATLDRATSDEIAFLSDRRYLDRLRSTRAGAVFVAAAHASAAPEGCAALVTASPQAAYATAAARLHASRRAPQDGPTVHPEAELEPGVSIGHGAVISPGVKIGAGTEIGPYAVIGPGVTIGRHSRIGAHATVGHALIGDRVHIMAGAVVGESGFGVAAGAGGLIDMPQLGRVIIQDGVSIGANSCIDRGAYEDTVIGENTKIDNLVQVGHNCVIGRDCVLAGHVGLSGSVTVGDGAMFGGRAGIADHLIIGAGAKIAAAAGVMKDVPAGEVWCGAPARPVRRFMRETAWLARAAQGRPGDDAR